MPSTPISVVILTFNSANSIRRTLSAALKVSGDIHVVDSFSTDDTVEICRSFGCAVSQRKFVNYADQRNWAINSLPLENDWELHLDADEEMEPSLISALNSLEFSPGIDGYIFGRKIVFLGKVLRFGGVDRTWHCRLFRRGAGRCENRLYDQHFVCAGETITLRHFMLDHQEDTLSEWTRRHDRWSELEALEIYGNTKQANPEISPSLNGNIIQRKRYYKGLYYKLPLFLRPVLYYLYRVVFRLGFLDGVRGGIYHTLQGFWFRFLVDAKIYELKHQKSKPPPLFPN